MNLYIISDHGHEVNRATTSNETSLRPALDNRSQSHRLDSKIGGGKGQMPESRGSLK